MITATEKRQITMTYFVRVHPIGGMSCEDLTRFVCKAAGAQSPLVMVEQASFELRVGYVHCDGRREAEALAAGLSGARCGGAALCADAVQIADDFAGQIAVGGAAAESDAERGERRRERRERKERKHERKERRRSGSERYGRAEAFDAAVDESDGADEGEMRIAQRAEVSVAPGEEGAQERRERRAHRRRRERESSDSGDEGAGRRHSHHHRHH